MILWAVLSLQRWVVVVKCSDYLFHVCWPFLSLAPVNVLLWTTRTPERSVILTGGVDMTHLRTMSIQCCNNLDGSCPHHVLLLLIPLNNNYCLHNFVVSASQWITVGRARERTKICNENNGIIISMTRCARQRRYLCHWRVDGGN